MKMIDNVIQLSYDDVQELTSRLAEQVKALDPDLIVGITRGGLVPAVELSHKLGVPMDTVNWQTRDGSYREHKLSIKDAILNSKTVVFVDDINDTGLTMKHMMHVYGWNICDSPNVYFATLIEKCSSSERAHCVGLRIDDSRWVVFPYENNGEVK